MNRGFLVGTAGALGATALWGFTFLGPVAVCPINIYYLVVGRYAVFGLLSIVVLVVNRPRWRAMGARRLVQALHLGVVGYIGFYLLLSMSASVGGGVLASMLTGLIPAMVSLASNALRKAIRWWALLLPLVLTTGGLVLVNAGSAGSTDGQGVLAGTLLGVAASAAWTYFVVTNGVVVRQDGFRVDNAIWTATIGLGAFVASLAILPLALAAGGRSPVTDPAVWWSFAAWCVALAVLGSWCATWLWNIATRHLSTTMLGPIIGMEAVFGAAFNLGWQRRLPTTTELWGGLCVVAGVFVCAYLFNNARAAVHVTVRRVDHSSPGGLTMSGSGDRGGDVVAVGDDDGAARVE